MNPAAPTPFEGLILIVLGTGIEATHEVSPDDFGEYSGRRTMFIRCVTMLKQRYPTLEIDISGDRAALVDMGLIPGGEISIDHRTYRTLVGSTIAPGKSRLTVSRKA